MIICHARAASVTAIAVLLLSGCSGGKTGGDETPDRAGTTAPAVSKDPSAPVLAAGKIVNVTQEFATAHTTQVPGPAGSILNVMVAAPTTGTSEVAAEDGKKYSAPEGYALTVVRLRPSWGGPTIRATGRPAIDAYTKPMTVTVKAGNQNVPVATLTGQGVAGGGAWLVPIPNKGQDAAVVVATDGGQQVVDIATGQRDEKTSNGVAVTARVTAPVTSATACDAGEAPKTGLPANVTVSGPVTCNGGWFVTDHIDGAGWAPVGGYLLAYQGGFTAPKVTYTKDSSLLGSDDYPMTSGLTVASNPAGPPVAHQTTVPIDGTTVVFKVAPGQTVQKVSMNVTWRARQVLNGGNGFPQELTLTAPASLTAANSTATLTYQQKDGQ